jgi:Cu2+-exporting ATPase
MKTSVIEVHDMLSVLSAIGVEKKIGEVPGVESVTVNYAAGSATVRYDETRINIADIKSDVRQSGYKSVAPAETSVGDGHKSRTAPAAPSATPVAALPKSAAAAAAPTGATPASDGKQDKAAPDAAAPTTVATAPKPSPTAAPSSPAPKSASDDAAAGDGQKIKASNEK